MATVVDLSGNSPVHPLRTDTHIKSDKEVLRDIAADVEDSEAILVDIETNTTP